MDWCNGPRQAGQSKTARAQDYKTRHIGPRVQKRGNRRQPSLFRFYSHTQVSALVWRLQERHSWDTEEGKGTRKGIEYSCEDYRKDMEGSARLMVRGAEQCRVDRQESRVKSSGGHGQRVQQEIGRGDCWLLAGHYSILMYKQTCMLFIAPQ